MEGNNFHLQGLVQIFLHLATSFCFTFFYLYAHKCYYFKSIIFAINFFMKKEEVCQWLNILPACSFSALVGTSNGLQNIWVSVTPRIFTASLLTIYIFDSTSKRI